MLRLPYNFEPSGKAYLSSMETIINIVDFIEFVIKTYPDYAIKYAVLSHDYWQALKEEYDSHGG